MTNHRQIVSDEQVAEAEPLLQVLQQVDHAGLDADVERRHRLVEHHELRVEGEGPGDADTLPLAARELVGEAPRMVGCEADEFEQFGDPCLVIDVDLLDAQWFSDRGTDRESRVERRLRILEHDLHLAAQGAHLLATERRDVDRP